jgi:hypothetical protein
MKEARDERVEKEKVKRGCNAIIVGVRDERAEREDRV